MKIQLFQTSPNMCDKPAVKKKNGPPILPLAALWNMPGKGHLWWWSMNFPWLLDDKKNIFSHVFRWWKMMFQKSSDDHRLFSHVFRWFSYQIDDERWCSKKVPIQFSLNFHVGDFPCLTRGVSCWSLTKSHKMGCIGDNTWDMWDGYHWIFQETRPGKPTLNNGI